jgi:hypothetical protein
MRLSQCQFIMIAAQLHMVKSKVITTHMKTIRMYVYLNNDVVIDFSCSGAIGLMNQSPGQWNNVETATYGIEIMVAHKTTEQILSLLLCRTFILSLHGFLGITFVLFPSNISESILNKIIMKSLTIKSGNELHLILCISDMVTFAKVKVTFLLNMCDRPRFGN